jgi:transposase
MPAPLQTTLTDEEDRTLAELRVATTVPQRTRDRAHMIRLNAQGWSAPAIAEIFEGHALTVRATLKRWQNDGLAGLWEAPGRGAKAKWQPEDFAYLEQCLLEDARTDNSAQLAKKLAQERQVNLSADRIRRILKKSRPLETHPPQSKWEARALRQSDELGCPERGSNTIGNRTIDRCRAR